jgi:AraC family transcriptional regulator
MTHRTELYSGPLITIADVACRSPACTGIADECATSFQAVFTRRGVFVKNSGRRNTVAEPTHVIFFDKGEEYRVTHPVAGGDDCTVYYCSDELARELIGDSFRGHGQRVAPNVLLAQQKLRRRIHRGLASPLQVEETALHIIRALAKSRTEQRMIKRERRRLADDTRVVLAACPSQSLTLGALARQVASSPFHLSRVFREEVGMPIHQFHLRLRLAVALDHLSSGDTPLSPLALDLGFSSHSHFATLFKRVYGTSPSAFRA